MCDVRRVYVEKKPDFAVRAAKLQEEIKNYLGIPGVVRVRELVRYDIENVSDEVYQKALVSVLSEPPLDLVFEEEFDPGDARVFSVEYLPEQFDQRADSAGQCIKLLDEEEVPFIRTATTYVIEGDITGEEFAAIKNHCINPVDSRESGMEKPDTVIGDLMLRRESPSLSGFCDMEEEALRELYDSLGLAMTFRDFLHIQSYFAGEEERDPGMTEIRVLDTYWSDHCRHTTFLTELRDIRFGEGYYAEPMRASFEQYKRDFGELCADRPDKCICLMDMALMAMRRLKKDGKLNDLEESEEVNACSIVAPITVDGREEEWLISFKNETHNHPTEIEPFGGAATCLGGAIRDPLSGRAYVYQAMRVTGAADPTVPVRDTMPGKLPQKRIVRAAAAGYSSYGNQVGVATGLVKEIYHPGYVAKRMEIGAVLGAAPRRAVRRRSPEPGDVVILVGGETGRDGLGGATGSSQAHTTESIDTCGAQVQKGNPPTERKLQRLFRREEVSRLIKKCNDFGAGGIAVAVGELADGLRIYLDNIPKKFADLDGTELALSESQERMAVVLSLEDRDEFLEYAAEENLEAVQVAFVMEDKYLVLLRHGNEAIVDLSREFLDTNGAHQETDVDVDIPSKEENYLAGIAIPAVAADIRSGDVRAAWLDTLRDLNVCSQKGLVEMFDSSIGAGSVCMPYGGRYQLTETQAMVAKVPVPDGESDAVTLMSYGFDPYLSSWSPYHGAAYAVIESVAKVVATGGDYKKIHFSFQEYFPRLGGDPARWGQPFAALLGAYSAQMGLELASVGGKDSMSGTFNGIDVPPTLVSFAVDVATQADIVTPELKQAGDKLMRFSIDRDAFDLPDYAQVKKLYGAVHALTGQKKLLAVYALDAKGLIAAVSKMAFGNRLGVSIRGCVDPEEAFAPAIGDLVAEVAGEDVSAVESAMEEAGLCANASVIGSVRKDPVFCYGEAKIPAEEALAAWEGTLESVFPTQADRRGEAELPLEIHREKEIYVCRHKVARPTVFIPVFPGTNCEYDTARAFERAGADVVTKVFRNLTPADIRDSVEAFVWEIDRAQILVFAGGFSAGDEPEGAAKFFATAFRNVRMWGAVERLLRERDGLILGICNGFQALIKLGLVPYGHIQDGDAGSPTLTYNTIGRHVSKVVRTKVVSDKSPWLLRAGLGSVYTTPASHGEGRFVAPRECLDSLIANGQVATRYVNEEGVPTMDGEWNVNGSRMAIEGITSPDGRVLGKMAHPERRGTGVAINITGEQDMKIFESGVEFFR